MEASMETNLHAEHFPRNECVFDLETFWLITNRAITISYNLMNIAKYSN